MVFLSSETAHLGSETAYLEPETTLLKKFIVFLSSEMVFLGSEIARLDRDHVLAACRNGEWKGLPFRRPPKTFSRLASIQKTMEASLSNHK